MIVVCLFSLVFGSFVITQSSAKAQVQAAPTITEFPIPASNSQPESITAGPDGNIWYIGVSGKTIGRITPSGKITEFAVPIGFSNPAPIGQQTHITGGTDGNVWFTEYYGKVIGKITPNGTISEYSLSKLPTSLTVGPDGNIWFVESDQWQHTGNIGTITPSGVITEFPNLSNGTIPGRIIHGKDGNLWFTEAAWNGKIGRITLSGVITEFPLPFSNGYPEEITNGPDGNIWFVDIGTNTFGQITSNGVITEFPAITSSWSTITSGSDGNLWFTIAPTGQIGQFTTSGKIITFSIPTTNSFPEGITSGPDGNIWFAETGGNKIGRVNIAHPAPVKPTGKWITKTGFNVAVGKSFTIQASAYPTHSGDPAIAHVNFTATWPGHGWVDLCGNVTAHTAQNVYSCSTDFTKLNGNIPVPEGSITVTFNVTDTKGNVNNSPNGSLSGKIGSTFLNVVYIDQFKSTGYPAADCGPTSVAMSLYYTHRVATLDGNTIADVRSATGTKSGDTNPVQLETALKFYKQGYSPIKSSIATSSMITTMVNALKQGHPSIILIDANVKSAQNGLNRSYPGGGGHYVLLVGTSPDGKTFYVNDPDNLVNKPGINGGPNLPLSMATLTASIDGGKKLWNGDDMITMA